MLLSGMLVSVLLQTAPGLEAAAVLAAASDSSTAAAARRYAAAHLPLTAGDLVSRHLSTRSAPADAGPHLVLLAARSYAQADAWSSVRRVLVGQAWLDSIPSSDGRALLARAYLELDSLDASLSSYERFFESRLGGPTPSIEHQVGYARALARSGAHQRAADQLLSGSMRAPELARWFDLSALQQLALAGDRAAAEQLAARLSRDPLVPRDSVRRELAIAALQAGDGEAGLHLARQLSERSRAMLAGSWTVPAMLADGDTAGAVRALRGALAPSAGHEVGRLLVELDPRWETLRDVAQSDRAAGRDERAISLLRRAIDDAPASEHSDLAESLARGQFATGDYQGAVWTLAPLLERSPPPGRGRPEDAPRWLLAGRSFTRMGAREAAEEAYRRAARSGFGQSSAFAAYLLADHLQDEGRISGATAAYEEAVARFPRSSYAARSIIRLGFLAFHREDFEGAEEWFTTYRRRYPGGTWYHAAIYWIGRANEEAGDPAAARTLYREALGYSPLSYYGILAGRRLGRDPWETAVRPDVRRAPPLESELSTLVERLELLRDLGWRDRAARELETALADVPRDQLLPLAEALNEAGWTRAGIRLGWRVRQREAGPWREATLRAVYPLPYRSAIEMFAAERDLDEPLVFGLIRRESLFDREIVSPAAAVGLMQLLPRTAHEISREATVRDFSTAQLTVPEVNIRLGTLYLRLMLDRFSDSVVAALISYNAGPHRYLAWRHFPEREADEELFVERIPFRETRVYVKEVTTNRYIYDRLYASNPPKVDAAQRGR